MNDRLPRDELARMLSRTVGDGPARAAVSAAAEALGLGLELDVEEAQQVLEKIADGGGLLGTTARFAKSRLHLRFG